MYTTFYNLHRRPFENSPDPGMLFLSKQHREVLYSLIYGIEEAKGFILLAGDVGTGKTTLVRALLKEISTKHLVINVVNPHVGFDDMLDHLLHKLGLTPSGRISLAVLETLKEQLTVIHGQGQRVVLLIDEAHLLTEDSLEGIRLLSNIEEDCVKLIQIVLVGQNEIYALLNRESQKSLLQRIVVSRQLRSLGWTEASSYVAHRLAAVGRGTPMFAPQAIALIWRASGGIPRLMNQICDNALLTGYAGEQVIIGRKIIQEVLNDMGPMQPRGKFQFLRQPMSVWPSWSIAALCIALFVGMAVIGLTRQDQVNHTQSSVSQVMATSLAEVEVVVRDTVVSDQKPGVTETTEEAAAVPAVVTTRLPGTGVQSMPANETLWTMAVKIYGGGSETLIDLIQMANTGLRDINKVKYGQIVDFPEITRASMLSRGYDGKIHIHYASFYQEENAQRTQDKLKQAGLDAFFVASRQKDVEVFRVYVGDFTRKEDAVAVLNTLDFKNLPFLNETEKEKGSYAN